MNIRQTTIPGLVVAESTPRIDERGSFTRLYCQEELGEVIGTRQIVQINQSSTRSVGAVRGLHYQHAPHAEMKLVRCLKGKVWDVVALLDIAWAMPKGIKDVPPRLGRLRLQLVGIDGRQVFLGAVTN